MRVLYIQLLSLLIIFAICSSSESTKNIDIGGTRGYINDMKYSSLDNQGTEAAGSESQYVRDRSHMDVYPFEAPWKLENYNQMDYQPKVDYPKVPKVTGHPVLTNGQKLSLNTVDLRDDLIKLVKTYFNIKYDNEKKTYSVSNIGKGIELQNSAPGTLIQSQASCKANPVVVIPKPWKQAPGRPVAVPQTTNPDLFPKVSTIEIGKSISDLGSTGGNLIINSTNVGDQYQNGTITNYSLGNQVQSGVIDKSNQTTIDSNQTQSTTNVSIINPDKLAINTDKLAINLNQTTQIGLAGISSLTISNSTNSQDIVAVNGNANTQTGLSNNNSAINSSLTIISANPTGVMTNTSLSINTALQTNGLTQGSATAYSTTTSNLNTGTVQTGNTINALNAPINPVLPSGGTTYSNTQANNLITTTQSGPSTGSQSNTVNILPISIGNTQTTSTNLIIQPGSTTTSVSLDTSNFINKNTNNVPLADKTSTTPSSNISSGNIAQAQRNPQNNSTVAVNSFMTTSTGTYIRFSHIALTIVLIILSIF